MTQQEFADKLKIPKRSNENWEGRAASHRGICGYSKSNTAWRNITKNNFKKFAKGVDNSLKRVVK
jgi:hypothetical protein